MGGRDELETMPTSVARSCEVVPSLRRARAAFVPVLVSTVPGPAWEPVCTSFRLNNLQLQAPPQPLRQVQHAVLRVRVRPQLTNQHFIAREVRPTLLHAALVT